MGQGRRSQKRNAALTHQTCQSDISTLVGELSGHGAVALRPFSSLNVSRSVVPVVSCFRLFSQKRPRVLYRTIPRSLPGMRTTIWSHRFSRRKEIQVDCHEASTAPQSAAFQSVKRSKSDLESINDAKVSSRCQTRCFRITSTTWH
jgi:hypothetical protein